LCLMKSRELQNVAFFTCLIVFMTQTEKSFDFVTCLQIIQDAYY
jgi:hypothetical protein